jgi:hypothetical protein
LTRSHEGQPIPFAVFAVVDPSLGSTRIVVASKLPGFFREGAPSTLMRWPL